MPAFIGNFTNQVVKRTVIFTGKAARLVRGWPVFNHFFLKLFSYKKRPYNPMILLHIICKIYKNFEIFNHFFLGSENIISGDDIKKMQFLPTITMKKKCCLRSSRNRTRYRLSQFSETIFLQKTAILSYYPIILLHTIFNN